MNSQSYQNRRSALRQAMPDCLALFLGGQLLPRNYRDNVYPFRQSSHLLYLCGINLPGVALVLTPGGEDILFGPPEDIDDVVWHGPHDSLEVLAQRAGIQTTRDIADLGEFLSSATCQGQKVSYLPPFQGDITLQMASLLKQTPEAISKGADLDLAMVIANMRAVKDDEEIAEMEDALAITAKMHHAAMAAARPGIQESAVVAAALQHALAADRAQSYNPIMTVRGEVLHNNHYENTLQDGDLFLNDSGAESTHFYASDITRTFPVNGKYSADQKAIYEAVLKSQLLAIEAIKPGVSYREVHLEASRIMAAGLIDLGIMKGDANSAVESGAHALFFPHGLGHMIGLDVHDMEDLGDLVGYAPDENRSKQFGLSFLRFAKPLKAGYVMTVEPGIYFIPALIDRWKAENRHPEFINYDRVEEFKNFGGIRIEDDVLCTDSGPKVLGPGIAKTVDEVEAMMASGAD